MNKLIKVIDLDIVFKALKEGIIDYDKDYLRNVSLIYSKDENEWYFKVNYSPVSVGYIKVNDHGKTWWLKEDKRV